MSNLVAYGKYDPKKAAQERESLGSGEFLKLEGKKKLRFLPPKLGKDSPFSITFQHFIRSPVSDKPFSFNCPRVVARKPCPACEQVDKLAASPHPADQKRAREISAKPRIFANVVDRNNPQKGPQVVAFPKTVHKALTDLMADEDWGDFTSPYGPKDLASFADLPKEDRPDIGYDVTIKRDGQGIDTEYTVTGSPQRNPLAPTPEIAQEWIDSQADLGKYTRIMSYDEILGQLADAMGAETPNRKASPKTRTIEADAYDEE